MRLYTSAISHRGEYPFLCDHIGCNPRIQAFTVHFIEYFLCIPSYFAFNLHFRVFLSYRLLKVFRNIYPHLSPHLICDIIIVKLFGRTIFTPLLKLDLNLLLCLLSLQHPLRFSPNHRLFLSSPGPLWVYSYGS